MDVDKLRPGTVPMAPENILWFEFLLDPTLLEKHLANEKPDPSPLDLIGKFLCLDQKNEMVTGEIDKVERNFPSDSFKAAALKVLTMKVISHLKWDLDLLTSRFHSKVVDQILIDLLDMAVENVKVDTQNYKENLMDHQTIFALHLIHRWTLKSFMYNSLAWKHPRTPFWQTQGGQDPNALVSKKREEMLQVLDARAANSVEVLERMLEKESSLTVPNIQSFVQPTEESKEVNLKWETGLVISPEEFKCQIHFELANFLMFRDDIKRSRSHLLLCLNLFQQLKKINGSLEYCRVNEKTLQGLAIACDLPVSMKSPSESLVEKFKIAKTSNFQEVIKILQEDNLTQEIPLAERDILEMELMQSIASDSITVSKDLLMKLQILNAVRHIIVQTTPKTDALFLIRTYGEKALEYFVVLTSSVGKGASSDCRRNLQRYLFDLLIKCSSEGDVISGCLLSNEVIRGLFSETQSSYLAQLSMQDNVVPPLPLTSELTSSLKTSYPRLELANIQNQLVDANNFDSISNLVRTLSTLNPPIDLLRKDVRYDVPIPLRSAIMTIPAGITQNLVFVLLAKSRELWNRKVYGKAMELLNFASQETTKATGMNEHAQQKLKRLIGWEAVIIKVQKLIHSYQKQPKPNQEGVKLLTSSCKECLYAASSGGSVIPRTEVLENSAIALLNLGQWDSFVSFENRPFYVELAAALANACNDISKYKGTKKFERDAWDLILPVFGTSNKRNNLGNTVASSGYGLTPNSLIRFLKMLREPTVVTVVASLLARIYNVLMDEPNFEINCTYSGLFPAMITNSKSYNVSTVSEVLFQFSTEVLKSMPNNYSIIRLLGDLSYASADWGDAMRHYLEATALITDYFTQPVTKPFVDDFIIKRMIKCCTQLNCYTQAAVLCQCLDEVDYSTAFRCLTETKNLHCADAMDAYYPCVWDMTILEFLVNHHSKRGETQRKLQLVKMMGLLELNSNNNDEIRIEAAKIRKTRLFRALLLQYCVSMRTILHAQRDI